jgi:hypothetical protein
VAAASEFFLQDQLLLLVRHIQRGIFVDSPSRNTRGTQNQKGGGLVGQEVTADAHATNGGEKVTKRLSQKSMKKSTDGELFIVLNEHFGSLLLCRNMIVLP